MDFASNYTPAVKLKYTTGGFAHSMLVRTERGGMDGGGQVAVAEKLELVLQDLQPKLYADFTPVGMEYRLEDTDIWLPMDFLPAIVGEIPTSGRTNPQIATALHFSCKGVDGVLGGFFLFGSSLLAGTGTGADFIITTTEEAVLADAITRISETGPSFNTISGVQPVVWRRSVTAKVNDYIVKLFRGA